jgi:hypothetical protein
MLWEALTDKLFQERDELKRERDEARALVSELANAIADSGADIDITLMIKATSALDKWGE